MLDKTHKHLIPGLLLTLTGSACLVDDDGPGIPRDDEAEIDVENEQDDQDGQDNAQQDNEGQLADHAEVADFKRPERAILEAQEDLAGTLIADFSAAQLGTAPFDLKAEPYGGLHHFEWGECPDGFRSECTTMRVPLDWRRPWGETIEVFMSRLPAAVSGPPKGQIFLLQGGPGGSGESFERALDTKLAPFRDYDIYVLEHRGVGESTRLGCPEQEHVDSPGSFAITPDEEADCFQALRDEWGRDLGKFNITNAAVDLAYAVISTRSWWRPSYVYGVSYGTLWAQRYLQVAPHFSTGVILDSVLPPNGMSIFEFDQQSDPVGSDLAELCADDSVCGDYLGSDPWQEISDLKADIAGGHCPSLGLPAQIISDLGAFMVSDLDLRELLFPLIHRIRRCDAADVDTVHHFLNTLNSLFPPPTELPRFSPLLQFNIAFAEIVKEPVPGIDDVIEQCIDATLCPGFSVYARFAYEEWQPYSRDIFGGHWFWTRRPILALNGDLDPQTPVEDARRIDARLWYPWQNYVEIPHAPHAVAFTTPVEDPSAPTCGVSLMKAFAENPYAAPADDCLDDLQLVDFEVPSGLVEFMFDAEDPWENSLRAPGDKTRSGLSSDATASLIDRLAGTPAVERSARLHEALH